MSMFERAGWVIMLIGLPLGAQMIYDLFGQ